MRLKQYYFQRCLCVSIKCRITVQTHCKQFYGSQLLTYLTYKGQNWASHVRRISKHEYIIAEKKQFLEEFDMTLNVEV